jgi:hypothetical protein
MKEDMEKDVQLVMEGDEEYSSRPKTKPAQAIRGKMLIWPETKQYYFEGRKEHPEMKREVMHDKGGVKIAKTQGEKESSYILTAKVDGSSEDPYGDLMGKIASELKGKSKKEVQIPNANFLINREGRLQVWKRRKENQLCVFLTLDASVAKSVMLENLLDEVTSINKCIKQLKTKE